MDSNNIKLEIEMTNRERSDSVISDIEKALDIPIEKNKTLNKEEIERIQNKCSESYDKYEILIKILTSICVFSVGALIVYFVGVGLVKIFSSFFNYT
tara:strand:- start:5133 stop:5423 length:291 start_codon:yes stop_codon:yes gene_type:complete